MNTVACRLDEPNGETDPDGDVRATPGPPPGVRHEASPREVSARERRRLPCRHRHCRRHDDNGSVRRAEVLDVDVDVNVNVNIDVNDDVNDGERPRSQGELDDSRE
jgi:hypothetical protein